MKVTFNHKGLERLLSPPPPSKEEGARKFVQKLRDGLSLALIWGYAGAKSWTAIYYVNGKPRSAKLGTYPTMSIKEAKKAAHAFTPKAEDGRLTPGRAKSFGEVAKAWLFERVDRRGLRSAREMRRHIERYVLPHWQATPIRDIRRSHVNDLLRHIESENGYRQADVVLTTLSSLFHWQALQDDDFVVPVIRGMQRDPRPADEQKRSRILNDNEIKALWTATEEPTPYHGLIRMLLLSAQRWAKVLAMTAEQIDTNGVWTLPQESREKGNIERVKLPPLALDVIADTPQIDGSALLFGRGIHSGRALEKRRLDKRLREIVPDMEPWVHHDLRRTARSLLARAGVPRDHAERVLGHVQPGVEGVYDRHTYDAEKASALEMLARMVGSILDPMAASNVVPLRRS